MALRAKKPEATQERLKMLVYGDKGIGKTTAAMQFPRSYLIDMEKGSARYWKTLQEKKTDRFDTASFEDLVEEIKALMTTKHDYRTLIVDPITIAYEDLQDKWLKIFDKYAKSDKERDLKDYGMRYWGKVKFDSRMLRRIMTKLDMNIIATSHEKPKYKDQVNVGTTHDSDNKDGYMFDFIFRLEDRGGKKFAITEKKREEIGAPMFPPEFEWSYENFLKIYGREIIEKEANPIELSTPEQVKEIKHLLEVVNFPSEEVEKWFIKEKIEEWEEMESAKIAKCIEFVKKRLEPAKEAK